MDGVRVIFREYAEIVASAICFQSFERELAELPGSYTPPGGTLLLAIVDGRLAGCACLRRLDETAGEMKRLYVRPEFQGLGLGRALTDRVMEEARRIGYRVLRLDTLPKLDRAIGMYRRLGFREISPYGDNPAEAICFEKSI